MLKKKAVLLLSGGLDSATTAAIAKEKGYIISAVTFTYGQRHTIEIESSKKIVGFFSIDEHIIIPIPDALFKSALIRSSDIEIPKNMAPQTENDIPVTYVPARNIIFLSMALALAESIGAFDIFIGANAVDYSGYPDCRKEFFQAYETMARVGTKAGVSGESFTIHTPLIDLTKAEIIKNGVALGVDYSITHSCYDPDDKGRACGECDSCILRIKGFNEAGLKDPVCYIK